MRILRPMEDRGLSRRDLLAAGAATGAVLMTGGAAAASSWWSRTLDFGAHGDGDGWPGWTCPGVANLRRSGGRGLLEAGSDVFPCDPRPVAFALDRRARDAQISALVAAAGAGVGLVLRRTGPRDYYAAVYDDGRAALILLRRSPDGAHELARTSVPPPAGAFRLVFAAGGRRPTTLRATLGAVTVSARDAAGALQRAGDPGVLATARTLYPSAGPPAAPALGNVHLLPYGVQEGQVVMQTPAGKALLDTIRERSTAAFAQIVIAGAGRPATTRPSLIAATGGAPRAHGAELRVAVDVPSRVEIELASDARFRRFRRLPEQRTDDFEAVLATAARLPAGRRVYWRARLRRHGRSVLGPVRSFRVPPRAGSGAGARVAIAACASQFGPIFDLLEACRPDVFVWQGDLNYADTLGPLAQSESGYAGIWRDFLANPRTAAMFGRTLFAAQRDDHDYGVQDANSTNLVPWGLAPWEALVGRRRYYRFAVGMAEFWVLDQRRFKTAPDAPDGPGKTLLGGAQRAWLLRTLAASPAAFKVVCSPCTLAPLPANQRDGSWAVGYTAERDLLLAHVRERVSGQTLFVTGDTHWTVVYDRGGLFEARPCPLGIPTPNDITLTDPQAAETARGTSGVAYADDERGHFAVLDVSGADGVARLDLRLVREDGATPYERRFERAPG